jgi:hypothetical protein
VVFATLVLAASLLLADQLRVISNGLLLGGLFTMVYGVGWVIFSGNSVARFWVITLALVVSIGLGYLKFVRGRKRVASLSGDGLGASPTGDRRGGEPMRGTETGAVSAATSIDPVAFVELSKRVRSLEERATAAAAALGAERPPDRN